jgi:hypothetical protein
MLEGGVEPLKEIPACSIRFPRLFQYKNEASLMNPSSGLYLLLMGTREKVCFSYGLKTYQSRGSFVADRHGRMSDLKLSTQENNPLPTGEGS